MINLDNDRSSSLEPSHLGFCDETAWNDGRYRGIAMVSMLRDIAEEFLAGIRKRLKPLGSRELKWNAIGGHNEIGVAKTIIDVVSPSISSKTLRIDVLVWDIEDKRHKQHGRDDSQNLARMYYHLMKSVFSRWPIDANWRVCLDQHGDISIDALEHFLEHDRKKRQSPSQQILDGKDFHERRKSSRIMLEMRDSHAHPVLQVADLFVGIAVFSRKEANNYTTWKAKRSPQLSIEYKDSDQRTYDASGPSNRDLSRFDLVHHVETIYRTRRSPVVFNPRRGLHTKTPKYGLNFWHYETQSEHDRAPVKAKRQ